MRTHETPPKEQNICLWSDLSYCNACSLQNQLKCHFYPKDSLRFISLFLSFAIPGIFGLIVTNLTIWLIPWVTFLVVFLQIIENQILCSHCPYYAEEGKTLHCFANYGLRKIWPYNPSPLSRREQRGVIAGFVFLTFYFLPILFVGGQLVLFLLSASGILIFYWGLRTGDCNRCVNFSCPLNCVPQPLVDAFLSRNPIMQRAWKQAGYSSDNVQHDA